MFRIAKREVPGVICILLGIVLGCYLGLYLLLYGGIVQLLSSFNPFSAVGLAGGLVRILIAVPVGFWCFFILVVFGIYLIVDV